VYFYKLAQGAHKTKLVHISPLQESQGFKGQEFFPKIKDRLKMKITLTPNFTAMVTAHGKKRSYLHRLKIIDCPACPCDNGIQTVEHLIYECGKLNN
jgi:hypothetical protein